MRSDTLNQRGKIVQTIAVTNERQPAYQRARDGSTYIAHRSPVVPSGFELRRLVHIADVG